MRMIIICFFITMAINSTIVFSKENKINNDNVLAVVLNYKIMKSNFNSKNKEDNNRFFYKIWNILIDNYINNNKLFVTIEDIEKCPFIPYKNNLIKLTKEEIDRIKLDSKKLIQKWKVDKSLFKEFGGKVVSQQLYPYRPIGAYKMFLKKQESIGTFEIFDQEYKKIFWNHFNSADKLNGLVSNEIDFSTPWWCKK